MRALLAVLVIALSGTSAWLWHALQEERSRPESRPPAAGSEDMATASSAPISRTVTSHEEGDPKKPAADASDPSLESYAEHERRLLQDYTFREARRRFRELELTAGHIDLAKALGISEADASRLIAVLVDRELQYSTEPHPIPRTKEELDARRLKIQEAEQELDREIASIIGESRLELWKDYQSSLPVRHMVNRLGATLFAEGEPLKAEQVDALVEVIHEARKRSEQELRNFTAGLPWSGGSEAKSHVYREQRSMELTVAADKRIHEAAGRFLSFQQLQALDDVLRRQSEMQTAEYKMFRAQDEATRAMGDGG